MNHRFHMAARMTPLFGWTLVLAAPVGILGSLLLHVPVAAQGVSAMEELSVVCAVDEQQARPLTLGRKVLGSSACYACHFQGTTAYRTIDPEVTRIVGAEFLRRSVPDNWVL